MRLLVTGATTPLGGRVIRALLDDSRVERILATGIDADPPAGILPADPRLTYQATDLTHGRRAHDLLFGPAQRIGVDTVLHLATHRRAGAFRQSRALDVEGTRDLLLLAERQPA